MCSSSTLVSIYILDICPHFFSVTRNIMPHITQIACVESEHQDEFSTYVTPKMPMDAGAEKATGIVFDGKCLIVKGKKVDTVGIREMLEKLLDWLRQYRNVLLVAHNGRVFDFRVLCMAISRCGLEQRFKDTVLGFVDTLTTIKRKFPKLISYKQECLAQHFGLSEYNAHNAEDDVRMLNNIVRAANLSDSEMTKCSYSSNCHFQQELFNLSRSKNIDSLHVLVAKGVLKLCMAENIAGSGLALGHLKLVYDRSGEDGLTCVLSSKNRDGRPRITSSSKVLQAIIPKLCEYFASA